MLRSTSNRHFGWYAGRRLFITAHEAFQLGSTLALFGWLLLTIGVLCPANKIRNWFLFSGGRLLPITLSMLYLYLLFRFWGSAPDGDFASLDGVAILFASPGNLAGGWVHFLAFDLFIGRWMIDDVFESGLSTWRLILCLPLTFIIGPAGLVLHFSLRAFSSRVEAA